jgi:hypothetical protein
MGKIASFPQQVDAAQWRWAAEVCRDQSCPVQTEHVRGYEHCIKNPNPSKFAFSDPMGK